MEHLSDKEVGERLRSLREEAAERQVDLAAVLDLDQAAMSRIESGQRPLTARELALLGQHYGVPVSAILEPEPESALLRDGEANPAEISEALREFHRHIDAFFGARALAR